MFGGMRDNVVSKGQLVWMQVTALHVAPQECTGRNGREFIVQRSYTRNNGSGVRQLSFAIARELLRYFQ